MLKTESVVCVINYNCPQFIKEQVGRIRKYMSPSDIIIFDTSDTDKMATDVYNESADNQCFYVKIDLGKTLSPVTKVMKTPSHSHGHGLNCAYDTCKYHYKVICMMDHDTFPFDYTDILKRGEDKAIVGLYQGAEDNRYFLPNMLVLNTKKIAKYNIDFMPDSCSDTGGRLSAMIKDINTDDKDTIEYSEAEVSDIRYEVLDKSMHFIKGSNWNGEDDLSYKNRIGTLKQELKRLTVA